MGGDADRSAAGAALLRSDQRSAFVGDVQDAGRVEREQLVTYRFVDIRVKTSREYLATSSIFDDEPIDRFFILGASLADATIALKCHQHLERGSQYRALPRIYMLRADIGLDQPRQLIFDRHEDGTAIVEGIRRRQRGKLGLWSLVILDCAFGSASHFPVPLITPPQLRPPQD